MGYRVPNGIREDVLEIARTILSVVQIFEPEDEPVTCGMPYNFTVLNSPLIGHLGKNDHKYQLVKLILMKPIVLEEGHVGLPH